MDNRPGRSLVWRRYLLLMAIMHVLQIAHADSGSGSTGNSNSAGRGSLPNGVSLNRSELKELPSLASPVWPGDSDEGWDDDSSSDESEYESWMSLPEDATRYARRKPELKQHKPKTLNGRPSQSQPLKTLEKLQQMLDDTDYMTAKPDEHPGGNLPSDVPQVRKELEAEMPPSSFSPPTPPQIHQNHPPQQSASGTNQERLWTSADRSKYKQQQKRLRKKHSSSKSSLPPPNSDDDDPSDTDDGLEYTLPNLPIYLSDAEGDSEGEEHMPRNPYDQQHSIPQSQFTGQGQSYQKQQQQQQHHQRPSQGQHHQQQQQPQPPRSQPNPSHGVVLRPDQSAYNYPPSQYPMPLYPPDLYQQPHSQQPQHQQPQQSFEQVAPYHNPNSSPQQNGYAPYPYTSGQYGVGQSHSPQQQPPPQQPPQGYSPQFAAWAAAMGYVPAPSNGPKPPQSWARPPPPTISETRTAPVTMTTNNKKQQPKPREEEMPTERDISTYTPPTPEPNNQFAVTLTVQPQSLAEMSSKISFDSIQKLSLMLATATMACYAAVSPRKLPQVEYNAIFYDNIRILAFALVAPCVTFFSVLDAAENDLNQIIQSLYTSFSLGYMLVFLVEILSTTLVRLSVFVLLEPDVFALVPKIPVLILPWVLRENRYRPKRITLFAADFFTSCVACPLIEEYIKFKILQWTSRLPKNYSWVTKAKGSGAKKKKKKTKREKIPRGPGEKEVTTVNKYVSQMLAVSIGLKLADAGRRVLMYTKPHHADKSFYAICRGIFPIQELCGVMTALRLAKRDVLGAEMPTWWILAPAVIVHGMANFRGMKPIFKWNSATPWSEMQLSPWSAADASTLPQLASKGFSKLMWLIILMRVLGYCAKNYYYTNRQAEKRTTLYAGNPAAVDAALASSDLLKKAQGKQ